MICAKCQTENPPGFQFCGRCGAPLEAACPRCGAAIPPGFTFCGRCGAPLTPPLVPGAESSRSERRERGAAGLSEADLDHLRRYLPRTMVEALRFDLPTPSPRLLEQALGQLTRLLSAVQSHLPAGLVARISQDPTPGRVDGEFVAGTLLFADISGFTAMSERFSRIGREGAEEVTAIVNRYFERMLASLRDFGGQLIKFGGDALLGLFAEPTAADWPSAAWAAQAALRMQVTMAEFAETHTSLGVFPLQMKVSLRHGRFFAAQLGGAQEMEYALFGADVNATAVTAGLARAGQVALDAATLAAIGPAAGPAARPLPEHPGYFGLEGLAAGPEARPAPAAARPLAGSPLERVQATVRLLDALIPYLPSGLLARLAGQGTMVLSLAGEHRLVAILFANIHGLGEIVDRFGPGEETRLVAALNRYFQAMQAAVHSFGGVINKIDLYDHGDKLLAFFGAPVAHEDDGERAVRAARAMQAALAEVAPAIAAAGGPALRQQIGLSYGYVFAGYVGAHWQHEYTVMGDEVNLAARLMTTALDGQVRVSEAVRRKVKALFELTPCGEIQLKGKAAPVPVFNVEGERAVPEPLRGLEGIRSPLVGREVEWRQLVAAMEQVQIGRGQITRITGEAGLGKSRLVAELRLRYPDAGLAALPTAAGPPAAGPSLPALVRWLEGRCLSFTETVIYYPFIEVVRQIFSLRPDDSEAEAWTRLRAGVNQRLGAEAGESALPYLANFLGLPLDAQLQEKVRYLDAESLQRRTFLALRSLLEACAPPAPGAESSHSERRERGAGSPSPLVLVLEDLHWMDRASLSLLDFLLPLVNRLPLLVILLYRPDRERPCWVTHEKISREFAHCTVDIALEGLSASDSQELLRNLVPLENWPAEVRDLILSRTEGNPLYVEEVLRVLLDQGVLVRTPPGGWQVAGKAEVTVPDTLQGVMMARLDRLEEPPRRTAQISAVVGRSVAFDLLAHLTTAGTMDLNGWLANLQQHEILRETQRAPELVFAFTHALMQEVCYTSLPVSTRRDHHQRIATYLETAHGEAESHIPLVAYHAFAGQDWPRALRFQRRAGEEAQKLFANQEAALHFQRALESAAHLPAEATAADRQQAHLGLGELLTTTAQYETALEHLNQAVALAEAQSDVDGAARACRWLARLHELRGDYPQAFRFIDQGLGYLDGRATPEAAQLRLFAGLIYSRQGDYEKMRQEGEQARALAQALGEKTAVARADSLLGMFDLQSGSGAEAIQHFEQALGLYQAAGDLAGQATVHNLVGSAHFEMSRFTEADRAYRQARVIFEQIGDVYNRAFADNNLGEIALYQGRVDEALRFYQAALDSFEQIGGSPYVLGVLHMNLGASFIRQGEAGPAREHLGASQRYFEQAGGRDFLPEMNRHLARAALIAGQSEAAAAHIDEALRLAREMGMRAEEGNGLRVQGEIYRQQQRLPDAQLALQQSVAVLSELEQPFELARSRFSLARVQAEMGERAAARASLDQVIPVFERLEAALDLQAAQALRAQLAA